MKKTNDQVSAPTQNRSGQPSSTLCPPALHPYCPTRHMNTHPIENNNEQPPLPPHRPRSKPLLAYSYLLSYTLQSSHPFPLALVVLQRTLRSGCLPVPQTRVLLSSAWLERRCLSQSVADILL
ncbi:hypothetical protein DEO72_LG2g4373 [Vigna unguiculata]|uniref:Uncharacterized protein n=1 Tax=Vigna unguiculata TaxID=3917 RepID=A0A4D6L693_VIGUN|nr:hypothetical protein DEO72_LG2g4373 [Vigna unguiculata]